MRKIALLGAALVIAAYVSAQTGTITYSETMKLEIHLEGAGPGMEDLLPKERKVTRLLHYSPDVTLYLNQPKNEDQAVSEEMAGGGTVVVKMEEPDERVYVDLKNQKVTEQKDFMSRTFLIESSEETLPWKLTGNRKEILGRQCLEAFYVKDSTRTVAWFDPSTPVSSGPGKYRGLPGIILEVNVNDGKRIISATSIKQDDVSALLVKPKKGKKVSREEFNAIVEEKTGEQGAEGGNVFMIKINK
jgi:GLPGLI family protein